MGEFLKLHGLISNSTYEMLNNVCSYATMRRQLRATGKLSTSSFQINIQMEKEVGLYIYIFFLKNVFEFKRFDLQLTYISCSDRWLYRHIQHFG